MYDYDLSKNFGNCGTYISDDAPKAKSSALKEVYDSLENEYARLGNTVNDISIALNMILTDKSEPENTADKTEPEPSDAIGKITRLIKCINYQNFRLDRIYKHLNKII
jgi:hypothetical protein